MKPEWAPHTCPSPLQSPRPGRRLLMTLCLPLALCFAQPGGAEPAEPGRLFYTPAQRAQLEAARAQRPRTAHHQAAGGNAAAAPLRFDGQVTRSDGRTTRWVDGKAQLGTAGVSGLKPGQIRADGKVYEPYQRSRPGQPENNMKEAAP